MLDCVVDMVIYQFLCGLKSAFSIVSLSHISSHFLKEIYCWNQELSSDWSMECACLLGEISFQNGSLALGIFSPFRESSDGTQPEAWQRCQDHWCRAKIRMPIKQDGKVVKITSWIVVMSDYFRACHHEFCLTSTMFGGNVSSIPLLQPLTTLQPPLQS